MSRACNSVVLVGRLTSDVELLQASDHVVANFTVAKKKKKSGDREPETDFIPCQLWGKRAEVFAKYHRKGSGCNVCGEIRVDRYEKDGVSKIFTKVHVTDFAFIPSNNQEKQNTYNESTNVSNDTSNEESQSLNIEDDNLPF